MKKILFIILISTISFLHAVYLHEGWDAGSFSANAWVANPSSGNWQIMNAGGYHLRFAGFPPVENYDQSLSSKSFDISSASSLNLQFAMQGIAMDPDSNDSMTIEYSVDGAEWIEIFTVNASPGDVMDPLDPYNFDFPTPISGSNLQFRFRASGSDSASLLFWRIDDIMLTDQDYQNPATISGTVTDANLEPIAEALLTDGFNFARTDFSGNFSIRVQPAPSLTLTAEAFGFADATAEFTNIQTDTNISHNFSLLPEDPAIMDPYNLQGFMNYNESGIDVNLSWRSVHQFPNDGALELAYDSPPAEYFHQPFMINECEYMVVKFQRDWMLNIGAVKLALKSMMPTNIEIVAFYEVDGMPDINSPVFDSPKQFEFVPRVPGYPEWKQFPLMFDLPPLTPIYLGVKFRNGDLYSLGITPTDDSRSYMSYDSENVWEICDGEAAMIRLLATEFEPWDQRDFLGYNIYRNHILLNPSPLAEPFFGEESLPFGDQLYYVTAKYSTSESNVSNSLILRASELCISQVNTSGQQQEDPYANIDIKAYQVRGGLSSLSLLRNGVEIYNEDVFNPQQYLFQTMYRDYNLQNDTLVQYQLEAQYLDGSSLQSPIYEYRYLMPPSGVSAVGCESGVQLEWLAPVLPNRDLLGYKIVKMGGGEYLVLDELLIDTSFTDTDVVFGEVYEYIVRAVYQDGFAESDFIAVVAGPAVYHPVTGLSGSVENDLVKLSWQRPDDGFKIFGKDAPGTNDAPFSGENFIAYINFEAGDMMSVIDHRSVGIAFIPVTDDAVSVRVFNRTDPENEYLCFEHIVESPVPNQWNFVECNWLNIESILNAFRFELETNGGLMLDDSPEPIEGANGIYVGGNMSDLFSEYGIVQNWKFKIKLEQNESINPVSRGLYPILTGYLVFRDAEHIDSLSEFDENYQEPAASQESTSYYIVANYDSGESEPSNTVVIEPISNDENTAGAVPKLLTNYPNPFNPTTCISFEIKEAADVTLQIFNLRGQLVKTLYKGPLAAGSHALTWDGTDLHKRSAGSGVYFIRLNDGNSLHHKKMCLQK